MAKKETKILAIGAHPDDIEFKGGGTLALLKILHGDNVKISMLTICNGDMCSAELNALSSSEKQDGQKAINLLL